MSVWHDGTKEYPQVEREILIMKRTSYDRISWVGARIGFYENGNRMSNNTTIDSLYDDEDVEVITRGYYGYSHEDGYPMNYGLDTVIWCYPEELYKETVPDALKAICEEL